MFFSAGNGIVIPPSSNGSAMVHLRQKYGLHAPAQIGFKVMHKNLHRLRKGVIFDVVQHRLINIHFSFAGPAGIRIANTTVRRFSRRERPPHRFQTCESRLPFGESGVFRLAPRFNKPPGGFIPPGMVRPHPPVNPAFQVFYLDGIQAEPETKVIQL
jgi:hypothetical protein